MTQIPEPPSVAGPSQPPVKGGGMLRSSAIFSGLTLVSRVVGFARDVVITAALGVAIAIREAKAEGTRKGTLASTYIRQPVPR